MNRPGTVEIKSGEILNLHTLDTFFYDPVNGNENLPKKIQLVLQRKRGIMKDIIVFYEVGSVVNYNNIEDGFFLRAVIAFLKDHTNLSSLIIREIDKHRINIEHDKFANSVKNILSNDTKMLIGVANLQKIEEKINNKEQSKIILAFLEHNPQYILSTITLILGSNNTDRVIKIISSIKDYNKIMRLMDSSYHFERINKNEIKMLNISDLYEIFSLMNRVVFFDNFITVINKTQVNDFITLFNKEGKANLLKYLESSDSTQQCIDRINGKTI